MATSPLTSTPISSSIPLKVPNCPKVFLSSSILSFSHCLIPFSTQLGSIYRQKRIDSGFSIQAQTLDFAGSFFEGGFGSDDDPSSPGTGFTSVEEKEEPQCPPGLRQYETMAVLRPDMSEDERLALTQKFEEVSIL